MKKVFVLLSLAVVFLCSSGFAIEWAGDHLIDLDAAGLTLGNATTWPNAAPTVGVFNVVQGTPEVQLVEEGSTGPKKMVSFFATSLSSAETDCMVWENPTPAGVTGGSDYTIEMWVRLTSRHEWNTIVGFADRRAAVPYGFGFYDTGGVHPIYAGDNLTYSQLPPLNKFTYLCFTFGGGTSSLYINGILDDSVPSAKSVTAGSELSLGGWHHGSDPNYYYGAGVGIAKVRIHDGVLTDPQILANYNEETADYQMAGPLVEVVEPFYKGGVGFGEVAAEAAPVTTTLIYQNSGDQDLIPTGIEITGSTAFTMNPASPDLSNLVPGATRTIEITFDPTDDTEQIGQLVITSNTGTSPDSIALAGNLDPIYVDGASGSDTTGDGTSGNPYATISKGIETLLPSGEIIVAPGTYNDLDSAGAIRGLYASFTAPDGATIGTPEIWTSSEGGEILSFEGFDFVRGSAILRVLFIQDGDNPISVTLKNCTFTYSRDDTMGNAGIIACGGAATTPNTYVLENCAFNFTNTVIGDAGFPISIGTVANVEMRGCVINNAVNALTLNGANAVGSSVTIEDCTITEPVATAISIGNVADVDVSISGSRITCGVGAITCDNPGNTQITNCIVDGGATGIVLGNNLTDVPMVYHCTLVSSNDSPHLTGVAINGGSADVSNCIVLGFDTAVDGTNVGSNDITDGVAQNPKFVYQAGGAFARPATRGGNDFHITAGSAAIGAGQSSFVTDDFDGLLRNIDYPSIGAYELEGFVQPTVAPPTTGVDDWTLFE